MNLLIAQSDQRICYFLSKGSAQSEYRELLESNEFSGSKSCVLKYVGFHNQIKCNKLKKFRSRSN